MYHVGRAGEAGFANKVLAAWGVDGRNSHTNVCSSGARVGFNLWVGSDRPSPDFEHADVIFLISSHLEAGHYFNPHAQRIIEAKQAGAKVIVFDTRLSNTATHADHYIAPYPGSEAAINLAIANHLIQNDLYNREFVRRWWNWQEYLEARHPTEEATFEHFEKVLKGLYAEYTFDYASAESGVDPDALRAVAKTVAGAGTRLSVHNWRSAASGNLGGWQVGPDSLHAVRSYGLRGHRGWDASRRLEQVHSQAHPRPPGTARVERAVVATGVPAFTSRNVDPAPALSP